MKKFFTISLMSLILVSCASTPEDYQVQINDAVKFYLASSDLLIEYNQDDKAEEFYDAIIDEFNATENEDEGFKRLLNEKVAEGNKYAKKVYFGYDKANILLSPYKPVEENVWEFEELGSEIHFTFSITSTSSKEEWTIEPNLKDIEKYMWKKYLGEEALQELRDLGMDVDSVFEATMNEASEDEEIKAVVCGAYSGKKDDKDVMTDEFYTELQTAFKYSNLDDWARNGYWKYADGTTHDYEIVSVEHKDANYAVVYLEITTDRQVASREIALDMKYVNDEWRISDICGVEREEISYSVWDFATVIVAENESNHEGNY